MVKANEIANPIIRTLYEVDTYRSIAEIHVRAWHKNIKRWRQWYDFEHYRKKALPYEERYPDPTPTNVVDLAVGIIQANEMKWSAKGWDPSPEEQHDASSVEKFLSGVVYINNERNQYHIPYENIFQFVRDGASVIYSVWDGELAEELKHTGENEEGQMVPIFDEVPVTVDIIDPLQIFLVPGGPKRWSHVIREWEMSVWDVEQQWDVVLPSYNMVSDSQKMQTKVKVQDFWQTKKIKEGGVRRTIVEQALVADGHVIFPLREMRGYDDIPYSIGFFKPIDRSNSAGWHGIIRPIESTMTFLEKAVNRRGRQIFVYSSLPFVARTIPNRKISLDPAIGNFVRLDLNEALEFPTWPGNPPDVEEHIGFMRARLQQAGFADVMFGAGQSQVSGYALSQLGDQSRIRLTQPIQHLELLWTIWARKVMRLVKEFVAEPAILKVYGSIRGHDFAEQLVAGELEAYMIKANIKPEYPNEKVRNHAMAAQVMGILPESMVMERYLDVDQPDDARKRRLQDAAANHPMMQQFAVMKYLIDIAENSKDKVMKAAAAMVIAQMNAPAAQAQTQVGPGGPEDTSTSPGNALGLASADGSATPQAEGEEPAGMSFDDQLKRLTENTPGFTPGNDQGLP